MKSKYNAYKVHKPDMMIGMLGCMAERLREKVLENKIVDLVAGPDAYRDLPRLLQIVEGDRSESAMNV